MTDQAIREVAPARKPSVEAQRAVEEWYNAPSRVNSLALAFDAFAEAARAKAEPLPHRLGQVHYDAARIWLVASQQASGNESADIIAAALERERREALEEERARCWTWMKHARLGYADFDTATCAIRDGDPVREPLPKAAL